jgi:peroxiredoxin
MCWWLVDRVSRMLQPDERTAVRGDLAESGESCGQALRDVLGLIIRRQASLWMDWRPWLALVGLVVPLGILLSLVSRRTADWSAIHIWLYANNWDWAFLGNTAFQQDFPPILAGVLMSYFTLICWSWTTGFAIGSLSRRTIHVNGALFCLMLLLEALMGPPRFLVPSLFVHRARNFDSNAAVFAVSFYRVMFPPIVQGVFVLVPSLWGMRQGLRLATLRGPLPTILWSGAIATTAAIAIQSWGWWPIPTYILGQRFGRLGKLLLQAFVYWPVVYLIARAMRRRWSTRNNLMRAFALLLTLAGIAFAADQPTVRAALQPAKERKPAPNFALEDSSGRTVKLKDFHGKVVLLDFWATWCHGCKQEIPWFVAFQKTYGAKGFAVVGVSLDEGGWNVLRPFLAEANVPYRMLLGDEAIAARYGIKNMPDTFLIDKRGRVAAAYLAGLVDKDDVEANIKALLSKHGQRR